MLRNLGAESVQASISVIPHLARRWQHLFSNDQPQAILQETFNRPRNKRFYLKKNQINVFPVSDFHLCISSYNILLFFYLQC